MSRRRLESVAGERDPALLAANVRRRREIRGWSGRRLCAEAGISPQTLARIEAGGGCTLAVERKLAAVLGAVVGRLWEAVATQPHVLRTPETDRWHFAAPEDAERYRQRHAHDEEGPLRLDPDAVQDEAERARMGESGLARGFCRVTNAHLSVGVVISSVLEVYGRIEGDVPEGGLAYFHVLRGEIRNRVGDAVHEMREGHVLQTVMANPSWLEPAQPVARGGAPPLVVYVDLKPELNRLSRGVKALDPSRLTVRRVWASDPLAPPLDGSRSKDHTCL